MSNPRTNQATSTRSQRTCPRTFPRKRRRKCPISLRLSLLGVRCGLRFRKRKTRTPPSKFNLSLPTNQDSLSSQLIRSSSETFLHKQTLGHHKLNSANSTDHSPSVTSSSFNLSTTTVT